MGSGFYTVSQFNMPEKVIPVNLRRMARAIAASYGDDGVIVISVGKEGTRIGVEGLTPQQIQDALCLAIHYNFCFDAAEATSPCPTSPD